MIRFDNTEVAFSIRSDSELRQAKFLYWLISYPWLVKMGNSVVSALASVGFPVNWIVKPTVYKQFVGGETISECIPVVKKLASKNVRSILDYSVEGKEEDEDIELALGETLRAIEFAGKNPDVPFAVFKPTAFIRSESLEKLGNDEAGLQNGVLEDGRKFRDRIGRLCHAASGFGLPIMIDAEDVVYQNCIDDIVYDMQRKYNRERALVFNTYQMYRRDRLGILERDYERAKKEGFYLGAKFVRGAYMERERARAEKNGYPDPIYPDKESTDKAYNEALRFSAMHIDRISIFNGTHNEYSSAWLADLMEKSGIAPDDKRVWFSQLYGMSDHISFNLAHMGYNVAKYVPYGPVKHVLPYLTRRAEENTSVKGQTGRELGLITREFRRRKNARRNK